MSITEAEARKVAHLARIAVADEALPALADFNSPFPYDGRPLGPLAP